MTRSKDFRYIFTNAFSARMSHNDIVIVFGMSESLKTEDIFEEVAIVMTPKTMKLMLKEFSKALEDLEAGESPDASNLRVSPSQSVRH